VNVVIGIAVARKPPRNQGRTFSQMLG
jgi:hypothetical protein